MLLTWNPIQLHRIDILTIKRKLRTGQGKAEQRRAGPGSAGRQGSARQGEHVFNKGGSRGRVVSLYNDYVVIYMFFSTQNMPSGGN